jgi:archaellum component FlaD/FlaE
MVTQKPYLRSVEGHPEQMSTALSWARYLGTTFGTSGALTALEYYERLDWITSEVTTAMVRYIRGLSLDETHNKKYDDPATLDPPLEALNGTAFAAHAQSLLFISDIAGDDLTEAVTLANLAARRVQTDGGTSAASDSVFEFGVVD